MSYVYICYGPYEACGVVRHRTQRLRGLKEQLESRGHTVQLIPTPHWDRVVIQIARRNIFRCRITNLNYNDDGNDDVVCRRAMAAVDDAIPRIRPDFFYPDIPLFSVEFFDQAIDEAFRLLNVREYIVHCLDSALTRVQVVQCIEEAMDEAMTGEFIHHLITEAMEVALHKDYMEDLIQGGLQEYYDKVDDEEETREFMRLLIVSAISRTHPDIKKLINDFVETVVQETLLEINEPGVMNVQQIIKDIVTNTIKQINHITIKGMVDDLVDTLILRSDRSTGSLTHAKSESELSHNSVSTYNSQKNYEEQDL